MLFRSPRCSGFRGPRCARRSSRSKSAAWSKCASARASVGKETGAGLRADYVVKADGFAGFSAAAGQRLASLPAVDAVIIEFE